MTAYAARQRLARPGEGAQPGEILLVTPAGRVAHRPSILGTSVAACGLRLDGAQLTFGAGQVLCGWCRRSKVGLVLRD